MGGAAFWPRFPLGFGRDETETFRAAVATERGPPLRGAWKGLGGGGGCG